jgi:hypothetical protein
LSLPGGIHALRFHDDFDGIASAALLLAGIEQEPPVDCRSVSYSHDRASWLRERLPPRTAVVDFLHHPDAAIWFDHHAAPFVGGLAQSRPMHVWAPEAPSCAAIVARHFGLKGRWTELARWADKIDSARWSSPEETLDDRIPAVRIYISLLGPGFERFAVHLIRLLGNEDLKSAANDSVVLTRALAAKELLDAGMRHLTRHAQCTDSVAIVECERSATPYVVPRYGTYLLFPNADYTLLNQQQGEGWKVTLSRNPWRGAPGPDIGRVFTEIGGGGHRDVGAVNLRDRETARAVARDMLDRLRVQSTGLCSPPLL